jgi:hypothetical protein
MDTNNMKWKYDHPNGVVTDASDGEVIAETTTGLPEQYGRLIASVPELRVLCVELHNELVGVQSMMEDEEDSVQEEHRDQMNAVDALILRSEQFLQPENVSRTDRATALRQHAAALLQRAQEEDALQPYLITHNYANGSTSYVLWNNGMPTEKQAVAVLMSAYEPDLDETLVIDNSLTIEEMTGTAETPSEENEEEETPASPSL